MNYRWYGLWANLCGSLLVLVSAWFESGRGILEQGLRPCPLVGLWLYRAGFRILLLGFGLQLWGAYHDGR
jgi:hypothetical protein